MPSDPNILFFDITVASLWRNHNTRSYPFFEKMTLLSAWMAGKDLVRRIPFLKHEHRADSLQSEWALVRFLS